MSRKKLPIGIQDFWKLRDYHALIHLTFSLIGVYIKSEVNSSKGRCDAIIETERYIYALEFKLDKSAEEALTQILEKGYLNSYQTSGKTLIALDINFSSAKKEVEGYKVQQYDNDL